jgi:phosphatidylserine decarboxylase
VITRYGFDVYFTVVTVCIVLVVVAFLFVEPRWARVAMTIAAAALFLFATNFFRDPDRTTPHDMSAIVSPADGKVIIIREVDQPEYIGGRATMVSVFMSPLNVHVNRNPVTGVVRHLRYVPGEYFAAFEDKASEKNEQMVIGMEYAKGKVLFKQIAGFVARRIVCELALDQPVRAGERFGMIKFGSRVDIFVPTDAKVAVAVGDITRAGETIIARHP